MLERGGKGEFGVANKNQQQRYAASQIDPDFALNSHGCLRDTIITNAACSFLAKNHYRPLEELILILQISDLWPISGFSAYCWGTAPSPVCFAFAPIRRRN
jgi:hypothetical protein